jgi:hypothetical protein
MWSVAVTLTVASVPSSGVRTNAGSAKDHERDKVFVATPKLPDGEDEAFVSGNAASPNARALVSIFKVPRCAPVEA